MIVTNLLIHDDFFKSKIQNALGYYLFFHHMVFLFQPRTTKILQLIEDPENGGSGGSGGGCAELSDDRDGKDETRSSAATRRARIEQRYSRGSYLISFFFQLIPSSPLRPSSSSCLFRSLLHVRLRSRKLPWIPRLVGGAAPLAALSTYSQRQDALLKRLFKQKMLLLLLLLLLLFFCFFLKL